MEGPAPLTQVEERIWRALNRLVTALPGLLNDDLVRGAGLTLTEYVVLMHLSEAPASRLRMTQLASATALSASRITRVVDRLLEQGLVLRERSDDDARGTLALLTAAGLARLRGAYPVHLASARRHVVDRVATADLATTAHVLEALARGATSPVRHRSAATEG